MRDPLLHVGATAAVALHAWALFAGEYLPYIDWSNHLALISALAHGGDTGALLYLDRSWAPTPYLAFYALTAAFAQIVSVPAAAKLSLLVATALSTYGAADLARACGRSPRVGLLGPLALFGYSLGYGFASFVFATPLLFFALARTESLLAVVDEGQPARRAWGALALALAGLYLGHALLFATAALLIGARTVAWALGRSGRPTVARRGFGLVASAALPILAIGLPVLLGRLGGGVASAGGDLFSFTPPADHLRTLQGNLLDRGSPRHLGTMYAAVALFGAWLGLSVYDGADDGRKLGFGLEIYAGLLSALYLFGPVSLNRPVEVWMVYPRFGILAAALIALLPRASLRGRLGAPAAVAALAVLAHNADITRDHVLEFDELARGYDPIRALVPERSRVLALTLPAPGDPMYRRPAFGSLYFYHLVDGAAYTAFLFDNPLHPVRPKAEGRPRAPPWRNLYTFDPTLHGRDFDFIVVRSPLLDTRLSRSPDHERVGGANGWTVYRTIDPRAAPRPPPARPRRAR